MRLFMLLFAVLLLPLPVQATQWEVVRFDEKQAIVYKLDRDSVMSQGHGANTWVIVERVNLFIKEACEDRDNGSCKENADPDSCARFMERLCPGGHDENYSELTMWEVTCTGQIKPYLSGKAEKEWYAVQPDTVEAAVQTAVCAK